jgi:hypothetical protein
VVSFALKPIHPPKEKIGHGRFPRHLKFFIHTVRRYMAYGVEKAM